MRSGRRWGLYDLDGDGTQERFTANGKVLRVQNASGEELYRVEVSGRPLGSTVRVAKIFADQPGLQILIFSHRMDNGEGQGYCFTFRRGVRQGELAWTTGPLENHYSPTLIVDDVDGDGRVDIVAAPHYRLQIFDAQSGRLKAEVPWEVGRNYGVLLTRPRKTAPQKDIYIISDFMPHVDAIRYRDGKWTHAWGHKYVEPNSPLPNGQEHALRVGPNPVADLDGDGQDEMVCLVLDTTIDESWHLHVRNCETGRLEHDLAGIWLWSVCDLDGDARCEIVYTPTDQIRPANFCDLHVANLTSAGLQDRAVLRDVHPQLMHAPLPLVMDTIADEGSTDLLTADPDGDGIKKLIVGKPSAAGRFEDQYVALRLTENDGLKSTWQFARPGHRLNLVSVGREEGQAFTTTVRDLDARTVLTLNEKGDLDHEQPLGEPGGFSTTAIVADLDHDGRNEVVVQDATQRIQVLQFLTDGSEPKVVWSLPGAAMNSRPGYGINAIFGVQSADLDGDGTREVVFAAEDSSGQSSLVCADAQGRLRWRHVFERCPWGGVQAGVNFWTFGKFSGREKGLDVYVDVHRRGRVSSEGCVLRGDDGKQIWNQKGLASAEAAMPFGGGIPAVADLDRDGDDDLVSMFWTIFASVSGRTGKAMFPPAYLPGPKYFNHWLAYSSPTLADLDGDGALDVYLNSAANSRGAYAATKTDGTPLWGEFHGFDEGSNGYGPVADLENDGLPEVVVPVLNGTLVCLDGKTGMRRWTVPVPVTGDVIAVNVDGKGGRDLVFGGTDGKMWAVRGSDGVSLWTIEAPGNPVAADIDGDGFVELLAVGPDGILRIVGNENVRRDR